MDNGIRQLWDAIGGLRARRKGANAGEIQGRHVSAAAPSDKDLWIWNDTDKKWEPSGSAQVLLSRATSNLDPLTNSFQSITGDGDSSKVRLLLPTIGDWLVEATAGFKREAGDPGVMVAALFVNDSGTEETGDARFVGAANLDEGTVGQRWKVTTTAVNTPIELKAKSANSEDALIRTEHTVLAACIGAGGGSVAAASDHGNLDGLGDTSDHTWALLVDGTRAGSTGVAQDFGSTGMKADVIAESTGAAGVTVDGVDVAAHDVATTGVHGAGGNTLLHSASTVSALTTIGTIGTGTWQGSVIDHERGGIEADISAITTGGLLVGTGAGAIGILGVGADGLVLTAQADGTVAWEAGGGAGLDLLVQGDLHTAGAAGADQALAIGAANTVLWTDGTDPSWSAAPRLANIADTAGTNRLTTGATNTITGNLGITGTLGVAGVAPIPTVWALFPNTLATASIAHSGIVLSTDITGTGTFLYAYGVNALFKAFMGRSANSSGSQVAGLKFQVLAGCTTNFTHTFTNLSGVYTGIYTGHYSGTLIVTKAAGIEIAAPSNLAGTPTVTTLHGILVKNQGFSFATTIYGIKVEDVTAGTNKYVVEAGASTPTATSGLFRMIGNFTAAANETPIYISEGATPTLRQLKTMDPGAGGANFAGGELVCILV